MSVRRSRPHGKPSKPCLFHGCGGVSTTPTDTHTILFPPSHSPHAPEYLPGEIGRSIDRCVSQGHSVTSDKPRRIRFSTDLVTRGDAQRWLCPHRAPALLYCTRSSFPAVDPAMAPRGRMGDVVTCVDGFDLRHTPIT
jgi:hypothetical protein